MVTRRVRKTRKQRGGSLQNAFSKIFGTKPGVRRGSVRNTRFTARCVYPNSTYKNLNVNALNYSTAELQDMCPPGAVIAQPKINAPPKVNSPPVVIEPPKIQNSDNKSTTETRSIPNISSSGSRSSEISIRSTKANLLRQRKIAGNIGRNKQNIDQQIANSREIHPHVYTNGK